MAKGGEQDELQKNMDKAKENLKAEEIKKVVISQKPTRKYRQGICNKEG
jgi:hypothetical protein